VSRHYDVCDALTVGKRHRDVCDVRQDASGMNFSIWEIELWMMKKKLLFSNLDSTFE
jgi:hypothetical protein